MIWVKALIDQTYTGNKYYVEHINKKKGIFCHSKRRYNFRTSCTFKNGKKPHYSFHCAAPQAKLVFE